MIATKIPTADTLYPQFKNMVHKFAWKYSRNSGMPVDDFLGEAQLIFCNAVKSYDSNRGAFSTHLHNQLQALTHHSDRETLHDARERPSVSMAVNPSFADSSYDKGDWIDNSVEAPDPAFQEAEMVEYMKAMPRDARLLALWFHAGELDPPESAKAKKGQLLKPWSIYRRKAIHFGWDWNRTQQAFNDLKAYMRMYRESACPHFEPAEDWV